MVSKVDNFSNTISRESNGSPVVNLTGADLGGQPLTVITDGAVQVKALASELVSSPAVVVASHMGSAGFDPAKQLISMGSAQLNRTGRGLGDVDSRVMVETAITQLSEAEMSGRDAFDLSIWLNAIKNIREIDESNGLHWNGQPMVGAQIFDHYEGDHSTVYGEARAELLRQAAAEALSTGQDQYIPLTLMTPELIRGWALGGRPSRKTVKSNLIAQASGLNRRIAFQLKNETQGQVTFKHASSYVELHFSAREDGDFASHICCVDLINGGIHWGLKKYIHASARPAALRVYAPKP